MSGSELPAGKRLVTGAPARMQPSHGQRTVVGSIRLPNLSAIESEALRSCPLDTPTTPMRCETTLTLRRLSFAKGPSG